jgi:hypothetical protein
MKHHFVKWTLLLLVFFSAVPAMAQISRQDSARFSNQLIRIEQQLVDDIASGSITNWSKYTHPDFFVVTEDGSMIYRAAFLEGFRPLPKGYIGTIKVIKPKTVFYQNTGIISYVADEYLSVFDSRMHTTYGVMDIYIRKDTLWQMVSSQVFEIPALPPAIQLPAAVLEKYTGTYQLSDSNTCEITVAKDTLYIQKKGRGKDALLPETENVFFRKVDARGRKIFLPGENGNLFMRERRNGQDVIWRRIYR